MLYKKRVSLGAFLKKGKDFKENDIVEIADEGRQIEGQFGMQDIFLIKLSDEKKGNVTFNSTSINNLIDAFGEDSKNWVGKKVKVWGILSNVQGKIIKVYYFAHPDAVLNNEGIFVLPQKKDERIPIVEEEEDTAEDIDSKDIPF